MSRKLCTALTITPGWCVGFVEVIDSELRKQVNTTAVAGSFIPHLSPRGQ
jgi:hypothetical protein